MSELITALTNLAKAATLYLEQQTHPVAVLPAAAAAEIPAPAAKKERKPRAAKMETVPAEATIPAAGPAAVAAAPVPADPLAELGLTSAAPAAPAAAAPVPAPAPALTPEQSMLEMKKVAVKCVQVFKSETPNGEVRLTGLLGSRYKVSRLSELSHENRLDFIAQVQAMIVNGGKA